ncbi:MAG TPA: diphthamide biosynthesis enzyme Dph2 [Thermoplasmata archaeon]|nr:diphthamide biosynthesis enzyme Dph2 [Thermoplasmata archaeon]
MPVPSVRSSPTRDAGEELRTYAEVSAALFDSLKKAGYRKIVLQVPAGLVRNAHDLAARIHQETGAHVVVLARACFGACDLPMPDEAPGAEAAVVLGHSPIPNVAVPMPTYFVEMRSSAGDVERLADLAAGSELPRRLGLVASVQHLGLVEPFTEALARRGFTVAVERGDLRLAHAAQALGCNYTGAEAVAGRVDAFLFLGTGRFHPIGLAFAVDRPVHALDPVRGELEPPVDRGALIRKRQLLVASCRDAQRWGLLVSSFVGQDRSGMARSLQRRAEAHGRTAEILVFGRLDPNDLIGRDLDAYVCTACPRIALDDTDLYPKPVLTGPEFLMALGELPLEPYRFDTYH